MDELDDNIEDEDDEEIMDEMGFVPELSNCPPIPKPETVKAHTSPKPPRKAPPEEEVCTYVQLKSLMIVQSPLYEPKLP